MDAESSHWKSSLLKNEIRVARSFRNPTKGEDFFQLGAESFTKAQSDAINLGLTRETIDWS